MKKIVYTQKLYETPSFVQFNDLAGYLKHDAFSLWNNTVKYREIGEKTFFADGKIKEVLFPVPKEVVVYYLQLYKVRTQQNVVLANIEECGDILFCDVSFVIVFGNKFSHKAVIRRSFENAAHCAVKKAKQFDFVSIQIIQNYFGNHGTFQSQFRITIKPDSCLDYDIVVNPDVCQMWAKDAVPENILEYFQAFCGRF